MKRFKYVMLGLLWATLPAGLLQAADGAALYQINCASCHGTDGKATTPAGRKLGAKDLTTGTLDDAGVEKQIRTGSSNGKMPAFQARLSPEEIAALTAQVKALRR